jgi:hypothetical protein
MWISAWCPQDVEGALLGLHSFVAKLKRSQEMDG